MIICKSFSNVLLVQAKTQ